MYKIHTSNVTLMVTDMDKAIDFYTKGLGLKLKQRWENHYAQVEAPGVVIGLHPADKADNFNPGFSIGFGIDSITEAENRLKELGIKYDLSGDKAGTIANFKDPFGTPLYFMESNINW